MYFYCLFILNQFRLSSNTQMNILRMNTMPGTILSTECADIFLIHKVKSGNISNERNHKLYEDPIVCIRASAGTKQTSKDILSLLGFALPLN